MKTKKGGEGNFTKQKNEHLA